MPNAFVSEAWNDLARWQALVLRQVAGGHDGLLLLVTEGVRARARCTLAFVLQAFGTAPAPQGAAGDAEHRAGLVPACTGGHGFVNQFDGHLFHRLKDQASSSMPQMAWAFFDSISNAAASASALSLR